MGDSSWVKAYADCTPELALQKLVEAVDADVCCFNGLSEEQRGERLFCCWEDGDDLIVGRARKTRESIDSIVYQPDPAHTSDWVCIGVSDGTIVAKRVDNILLKIKPHWNEETLTCDLCIDDQAFSVAHQAFSVAHLSQKILREFMFGR